MKKILLTLFAVAAGVVSAQVDEYGYKTVELTMDSNYSNRVFFDLSTEEINSYPANNWDIGFWRIDSYDYGTRINDAQGIEVYEASTNPSDWDAIDLDDIYNWGEPLFNPDQTTYLSEGAFEQGSVTSSNPNLPATGWGVYNAITHRIEGKSIFVLKYPNEEYYKFHIQEYYNGYTFKYAKWNGSSWDATQTKTIENGSNNNYFNYFSFDTNDVVNNIEPEIGAWDLMFTRYWTFYAGVMMYRISGVIQSPEVSVAKKQETQATDIFTLPSEDEYSNVITTIGHSWKDITTAYDDVVYYIKDGDKVYRLYFIENGGASTGNMFFKYKQVSGDMSVADVEMAQIQVYPNPVVNQLNISSQEIIQEVKIFNLNGQQINSVKPNSNSTNINVSQMKAGVYLVQIFTDKGVQTAKVIKK